MDESNTPQELGRTGSITHDAAWKNAYLAQLTDALADSVGAFAKQRARWLEARTKRKDDYLWRELLQDALTDTWLGDVTWDPATAPLDLHLKRVIRTRSSTLMKHLTQFPRVAAHAPRVELEREMSGAMEAERTTGYAGDLGGVIDSVVSTLHMLAADDDEVLRILGCFGDAVVDRRDILRATGMSATTYHNARRRLLALVERLPQHLRDEAIHAAA